MTKIMVLDSLRSMQNVGAIFRNADGSGFNKIILTGSSPTPPRNEISKTALGAQNYIDWEYYSDIMEVLVNLKQQGFKILGVELTPEAIDYKTLFNSKMEKVCLIMGNEVNGISQKVLDYCDNHIIIPMVGKKNSLNVSVAAGIVMYALV